MTGIFGRIASWFTIEPFLTLLMIVAATTLFLKSYKGAAPEGTSKFWSWCRRVLESIGSALLFLGLLWISRAVLNNNSESFAYGHGRVSETNYQSVEEIWGGAQAQRDLAVAHTIEKEVMEELPREDETKPPLFRKVLKRIDVEQNSILSTKASVELRPNRRQKGSAFYNGFETRFAIEYLVKNDSDLRTDAAFSFPLPSNQSMFSDIEILVDGKDISEDLRVSEEEIAWAKKMEPGETWKVEIKYRTRGMEFFYFQITAPRQIKDFVLTLTVLDLPVSEVNYPGGCIPPTEKIRATPDGKGSVLEWRFNNTITTAGMGVSLPQPAQPGERTSSMLAVSSYALMMLLLAICLTFILAGKDVKLLEIALISGVYCLMHIIAASLNDSLLGFWGSFALGAAITCALAYAFSRKFEPLYRNCLIGLTAFFSIAYPLLSQIKDSADTLNGLVMAGIIAYLFFIAMATRFKKGEKDIPS
jgi:hypothetical protein